MMEVLFEGSAIDRRVGQLFALVTEALAGATQALLRGEVALGSAVIEGDRLIDELTSDVEQTVWDQIDSGSPSADQLRRLIGILLILPELER
ncbi:MAG: PhoU domain-containing protein, partial [Acidimicrobiales bacterium]